MYELSLSLQGLHPGDAGPIRWTHADSLDELPAAVAAPFREAPLAGPLRGRLPSTVWVAAEIAPRDAVLRRLGLVVDGDQLVTVWLDPVVLLGRDTCGQHSSEELIPQVAGLAQHRPEVQSAADLGLLILYQLSVTFTHARRGVQRECEAFEDGLYEAMAQGAAPDAGAEARLRDLRRCVSGLRDALEALNQPGMKRDRGLIWTGSTGSPDLAEEVDEVIDRALRNLRDVADRQRSLMLTLLTRRQTVAQERFQRLASFVSFAIIAPGLVATVYGASIFSDGDNRTAGVIVMLLAMIVVGIGSAYAAHRWSERHRRSERARSRRPSRRDET